MFNLLVILLAAVILLVVLQIAVLIRVRSLIYQLKTAIWFLKPAVKQKDKQIRYSNPTIKTCEFCKYRKTYLSEHPHSSIDSIYYRCTIKDKNVDLKYSCNRFQPEFSLLDRSGQLG